MIAKSLMTKDMSDQRMRRANYHRAYGRSEYDMIHRYIIDKSLQAGKYTADILSLGAKLKELIDKASEKNKNCEPFIIDDDKVNMKFDSSEQFFDSNFYTLFLVANFREKLTYLKDLNQTEIMIKNLLTLSLSEKTLLDIYSKKSDRIIFPTLK